MKVYQSVEKLIGHTPVVELARIRESEGLKASLFAKLEMMNPAGSAKDRIAVSMLDQMEKDGKLLPGQTVIEPTSGNTGIGLAAVCAVRGYRLMIVMPDSMSPERIKTMKAYGAEVILTPGARGMAGSIEKAKEINKEIPGSVIAGQFDNPANPLAHYQTTGPELYEDMDGKIDLFAAGIGTGGTISGTGKYLKEKIPGIRIIGVEPAGSPVLSGGSAGKHDLQGIGAGFVPEILDRDIYDEILTITDEEAYCYGRMLAEQEGILAGITSGAALCAGVKLAKRPENEGKNIVILLPDSGVRYLSTRMFEA